MPIFERRELLGKFGLSKKVGRNHKTHIVWGEDDMEEEFDHLRCPMCGGELVYSEGTHDLCCRNNPYEHEESGADYGPGEGEGGKTALYEEAAEYSAGGDEDIREAEQGRYIYKVSPAGGRNGHKARESQAEGGDTEAADTGNRSVVRVETHGASKLLKSQERVESHGATDKGKSDDTPVKRHTCAFAVSFTESGRYGTLWSVRTVHGGTNYFSLMRLMQKIEKRQKRGEPLAANVPNLPRKKERTAASKVAFKYGIEVEDLYSIRYSSETAERLAGFYGISVRDVRNIKKAEIEGA